MRNAGLEEAQAGIKIARRNINNLRYAEDITVMTEVEEELKRLQMKVKEVPTQEASKQSNKTSDLCKVLCFVTQRQVVFLYQNCFLSQHIFPLKQSGMTFYNPAVLTLIIRKYVVSLLKIMADISNMDKATQEQFEC